MATKMVENSHPTSSNHGLEKKGNRLPIIGSVEFTAGVKMLAEVSGKSVETIAEEILHAGTKLLEKSVFEHCDVVLVEFVDGKISGLRGYRKKTDKHPQ